MTDKQSERESILYRLDELDRIEGNTTDRDTLKYIAERKQARRQTLDTL